MNCCSDKIDFSDLQCVRLYFANVERAKDVDLEFGFDEEGFFLQSDFSIDGIQIPSEQRIRRYSVNDIADAELFIEAWHYSKEFQASLSYLKRKYSI